MLINSLLVVNKGKNYPISGVYIANHFGHYCEKVDSNYYIANHFGSYVVKGPSMNYHIANHYGFYVEKANIT